MWTLRRKDEQRLEKQQGCQYERRGMSGGWGGKVNANKVRECGHDI